MPVFRFTTHSTALLTSYQHQFLSRPDISLRNIFTHFKYALILPETDKRITPALNKQQIYCMHENQQMNQLLIKFINYVW
jgi:hypothetical protein